MKNCSTCGKRNWEDALDCHSCGASLHDMEYQDCLFEYYRKCADNGSDALAKIMLTESANLGSKDATKEMRKLGLEIRPLIRYERKIVKSLKKEIYEYSGVDMNRPKPQKNKEDVSEFFTKNTIDDYIYGIFVYGGLGLAGLFIVLVLASIFIQATGIKLPWVEPPTAEQREGSLYDAWQSAKSNRDYWYRAAEKRYNKDGEISSAFKKYLEADRAADAAWKKYRDYSNSLEKRGGPQEDASGGGSSASAKKQIGEAVPGIRTHEGDLSLSETERKALANRKAQQKTFEERKTENVREAQRRLGLIIDSIQEDLGYDLEKSGIETIDKDYSNAISVLDNEANSLKQKVSAIEAASEAHSLYIKHKRMHPNLDEDEKRNGEEISRLNGVKTSIYAKSFELLRRLEALDKEFYILKDIDATNSLRLLEIKNRGMPSDSFRIFSFYIDKEHALSDFFGKGLIYMPNITPRIKQDDELESELFGFMMSEPAKQVEQLQRKLLMLKRTQDFHNSYRAKSQRLRDDYELMHNIYPLDRAKVEDFPSMTSDLENELVKIEEWKVSLDESNDLVNLFQKAEEPKVATGSHSNRVTGEKSQTSKEVEIYRYAQRLYDNNLDIADSMDPDSYERWIIQKTALKFKVTEEFAKEAHYKIAMEAAINSM